MQTIYDFPVKAANGQAKSMSEYKGKVLLIVNVASRCGYTPQYEGLEKLYQQYQAQGFQVIAFPCNDFGAQEPGTIEEIQQFCQTNYGVAFEVLDKASILGEQQHPLYRWLTASAQPDGDVKWNFEKFVISRDGSIVGRFPSKIAPDDPQLTDTIEQALV